MGKRLPFKQIPSSCHWPVSSITPSPQECHKAQFLAHFFSLLPLNAITSIKLSSSADLCLYADDICYHKELFSCSECQDVQSDVNAISDWVAFSGLQLNVSKTKSMSITRKNKSQNLHLVLHISTIEQVPFMKYLGIHLSSDLTWSKHISEVCNKARRIIGFLYRNFYLADSTCLNRLYQAIVLPKLDYCSCIWDPYQTTYIEKLERVQEFAAKLVMRNWHAHGSELVKQLGWPSLRHCRQFFKMCLCRRILCGDSLIPRNIFNPHSSARIRHKNSIPPFLPHVRTKYHKGSFTISSIPLWNSIPDSLITVQSRLTFKKLLKLFLF